MGLHTRAHTHKHTHMQVVTFAYISVVIVVDGRIYCFEEWPGYHSVFDLCNHT